ncbi:MAG: hypothetical protein OHK0011_06530 [Turneriella sp.]
MNVRSVLLPAGLILATAATRFLPHPENFSPVMSVALFGSAVFLNRFAGIALAIAAMAVSDYFIGMHSTLPFVYGSMVVAGMLGFFLREKRDALRILGTAFAGSVVFFLVTNLGVFLVQDLYPRTAAGLVQCYVMALPFFQNSLAVDLLFTAVLFGIYHLATRTGGTAVKAA